MMRLCKIDHHLGEDLIITDFNTLPFPKEDRHMECSIVGICLAGTGSYTTTGTKHNVCANDVLIVGRGQVLGNIEKSEDFKGIAFVISPNFMHSIIQEVRDVNRIFILSKKRPVLTITEKEVEMFLTYQKMLTAKMEDIDHAYRRKIIEALFASIVYDLCNSVMRYMDEDDTPKSPRMYEMFGKFLALVEKNFRTERRVSWYSKELGVTPKSLLDIVKRVSARTPNEWIDQYTLQELRVLLRTSPQSIKEIADELHFGTQASLGKFFKEHVGMSPSAYRQNRDK